MWKLAALLAALMFALAPPAAAKPRTLVPVDEAARDPDLAALIATLLKACDEKDFKPFEAAMSPDAIASFGGDSGPAGFRTVYRIDDPDSPFWDDFRTALLMGGAFVEDGLFAAPYVYANWPEDIDAFEYVVAIGERTTLYARPDAASKALADVTHQFLELQGDGADADLPDGWTRVSAGGTVGFVKTAETASPIGYRAIFQKTVNRWWLGAFVGGD